jgi:adenine-specific DNA-methyltransferase
MNATEQKYAIESAIKGFAARPIFDAAMDLLDTLGYRSDLALRVSGLKAFREILDQEGRLRDDAARVEEWKGVEFLRQITRDNISLSGQASLIPQEYAPDVVLSYIFLALELKRDRYTRTELAQITRAVCRVFGMPAMLIFKHGQTLTLSIINRRRHKRDAAKDVLEKVTLIKDISCLSPHRAHTEILFDLSLEQLHDKYTLNSFEQLQIAWSRTLDIQALNKSFFIKIRNWFYWARLHATFPKGARKDADDRDSDALIRLLTRLIFCWFLREKGLLPDDLFSAEKVENLLRDWRVGDCERDSAGRYYKAILQNLFFATLATPVAERKFRHSRSYQGKNKHYGDQRYFRYVDLFIEKAPVEELYKTIPFLNGGLFENLDEIPGRDPDVEEEIRVDGFSDVASKQPTLPDFLFFGPVTSVKELGALLGEAGAPKACGLFGILRDYKFTIEENTPLEEDLALDPELLGRTFENLLAAVNPETKTVARKSTGSFYTPREIVHYMAEEALVRYLLTILSPKDNVRPGLIKRVRELVSEEQGGHNLDSAEADTVVAALGSLRILDPACGSGAFPMGLLHLLVVVLRKLDPHNERWKAAKLFTLPLEMREQTEQVFRDESFDYTRKLELIKDCIHGVDIQPAAIQISKLRFFLSLVIEQRETRHIRPLPNLETKFVCANALLGLPRPEGWDLFLHQIEPRERELLDTRSRYFFAQTKEEKDVCKAEDRRLRRELSGFIQEIESGTSKYLASAIAAWDPYHGDRQAGYFDPESMFGVRDGFDITIGNPPYVRADEQSEWNQRQREQILASKQYETLWEKWDLYVPFIERGFKLLRPGGISTLIVSDAFCHSKYAQKSQNWFLRNARILRLDFCADLQIFDAAVHNLIYFFQRVNGANHQPERRVHRETFGNVTVLPSDTQENLTLRAFFPEDTTSLVFDGKTVQLGSIGYVSVGMVVNAHENLAQGAFTMEDLVQDSRDAKHPKRFVEGKHLGIWLPTTHRWLEWGTSRAPVFFRRQTFPEIYEASEKILAQRSPGPDPKCCYDDQHLYFTESTVSFVPWYAFGGVRNNSLKKVARYRGELPLRPDLPEREELETTSRRFAVKYLLGVMNSTPARDFLRANRRSNIHLYPDDWKKLPIPDVPLSEQEPIATLVDTILDAKRANPKADLSAFETELDAKVSALYGVAPEEIRIVEDTAK